MRTIHALLAVMLVATTACTGRSFDAAQERAKLPAFPGAEGFGSSSRGGRGGKVIKVTNLKTSGSGSLNWACRQEGPITVVFDVSGVIPGNVVIRSSNLTIAGQTAPGAGITIEGMLVTPYKADPRLHDLVIRFLRVRPRPVTKKGHGGDCLQISGVDRLMIDHVSCSWGSDENMDLCGSRDFTVQWCAIEESDTVGHEKGRHNFGMIMGYAGRNATVHHNLFAHHKRRAPLCGLEILDHRNNVIYNMGGTVSFHPARMNQSRPGKPFRANIIANYLKDGPDRPKEPFEGKPTKIWGGSKAEVYASGNLFTYSGGVVDPTEGPEKPWPAAPVETETAEKAFASVLASSGCLPRDAVGKRTIEEVRARSGKWGRHDPKGGLMAGLTPAKAPKDSDGDGLPDEWEQAHKLNPAEARDANKIVPKGASKDDHHKGYTYIEYYINQLADKLIQKALSETGK
jgi:pectate lyase